MENNIVVCVKQVPSTTKIKLDPVNLTLIREGIPDIINPFDEYAIEAALACKKKYNFKVGVVTMGPIQAKEILIYCLEKGADEAFLLTGKEMAGSDTLATARVLSSFIKKYNYKNVFCGQESIDSSTAHIGPSVGELLNIPQVTRVVELIDICEGKLRVKSEFEKEYKIIDITMPAVLTFLKNENKLTKKNKRVKESLVKTLNLDDIDLKEELIGLKGSPTAVTEINIDEDAINYLKVDSNLSAIERIDYILSGGVKENKNKIIFKELSSNAIEKFLKVINVF